MTSGAAILQSSMLRARELKHPMYLALQYVYRAGIHLFAEDWQACLPAAREVVRIASSAKDLGVACIGAMFSWWAAVGLGDRGAAEDERRQYTALHAKVGGTTGEDWARVVEIEVALGLGASDEALALAERVVGHARECGSVLVEALAQRCGARALAQLERHDDAAQRFAESLRVSDEAGALLLSARTHAAWARARDAVGDQRGAHHHTEKAMRLLT
jgi:hypothetical protein